MAGNESGSFTFLHDFKRLANKEYKLFGNLVSLAILHGCPGPRNIMVPVASYILGNEITTSISDIPDPEIKLKLEEIYSCNEDQLDHLVNNFPERFNAGVTQYKVPFSERATMIKNICQHHCTSLNLEEISQVMIGMNEIFDLLPIFQNNFHEGLKELT